MFNKAFIDEYQDAKVTIEVGDYRVTLEGKMKAPIKHDDYHDEIRLAGTPPFSDVETRVDMSIRVPRNIKIEQWRWTIPVAIRPRIEGK